MPYLVDQTIHPIDGVGDGADGILHEFGFFVTFSIAYERNCATEFARSASNAVSRFRLELAAFSKLAIRVTLRKLGAGVTPSRSPRNHSTVVADRTAQRNRPDDQLSGRDDTNVSLRAAIRAARCAGTGRRPAILVQIDDPLLLMNEARQLAVDADRCDTGDRVHLMASPSRA
jgi:hypothetical protein